MWMDYDGTGKYVSTVEGSNGKSYYTEALKGLIDEYVSKNPSIDKKRIYIGGCSNGGYMTMNMITSYPDYFAAAYPICEAYMDRWLSDAAVKSIKDMPIWFTHSKSDGTVSIYKGEMDKTTYLYKLTLDSKGKATAINDFSNAAYKRLKKAGAKNVHYSLFENVVDRTGLYFKAGKPYEYNGHYSWIYALNNECIDKINGKATSLFEWMSKQSK
jgi:predicted alpha/beta superfamily hydrolase